MKLYQINESIGRELEFLGGLGFKLLERYDASPYSLLLVQSPSGTFDVALTTDEAEFTTFDSQVKKSPSHRLNYIVMFKDLANKLREWLQKYGELSVGSFNKKRSYRYHSMLSRLGFKVGSVELVDNGDRFPVSYDFILSP